MIFRTMSRVDTVLSTPRTRKFLILVARRVNILIFRAHGLDLSPYPTLGLWFKKLQNTEGYLAMTVTVQ